MKKLVHIMLVVLATMVVRSVMVVMLKIAMTYLVTCQFTGTWRTVTNNKLSCYCFGFLFFLQVFAHLVFRTYFFWIHGHPAHIMWVFYWVSDNSRSWICVKISNAFLRYSCKNFFPRMLCREASIIKSGFITDNQTLN